MRGSGKYGTSTAAQLPVIQGALSNFDSFSGDPDELRKESTSYIVDAAGKVFSLVEIGKPTVENVATGTGSGTSLLYYGDRMLAHKAYAQAKSIPWGAGPGLIVETSFGKAFETEISVSTLDRFLEELAGWEDKISDRHRKGLVARLEYLFGDEPDLEKSQNRPDPDSFSVLLAFLSRYPEYKVPSISYNKEGIFAATWMGEKKLRMVIEFLSINNLRWVFVDSRAGVGKAITGAGVVSFEILSGVLETYKTTSWMRA